MDALMKIVDAVFGFVSYMPGWFWWVVVLAPPALTAVFYLRWWFGRPARWKRAAMEMGFDPPEKDAELGRLFPSLSVFAGEVPFEAETLWIFEGRFGRGQAWVADFNRRFTKQNRGRTVCVLQVPGAGWPTLELKEGKAPPHAKKIAGEWDDEKFDRTFHLAVGEPEAARKILTMDLRAALLRLAGRCTELERGADSFAVRMMLKILNQNESLAVAMAGDAFAVCARRYLDPASARDLLAAAETACGSLAR